MSTSEARQVYEDYDAALPRAQDISVDALIDDWEGFRILLRNHVTNGVIRIAFDTHLAYQSRDESDFVGEAGRSEGFVGGSYPCLYRVRNSEFVARYLKDSVRATISDAVTHFAIVTGGQCIDVIADSEPRIENLSDVARQLADKAIELQKKRLR